MRCAFGLIFALSLCAQEAGSGIEVRSNLTVESAASGARDTGGFRLMLYPAWKLSSHWTLAGTLQFRSRPFFLEDMATQGYGVRNDVLQLHLTYATYWRGGSLAVRAGELSSVFGSFLLHYDDAANPLVDMPPSYGYYYRNVTSLGLTGGQAELSEGKLDFRAQLTSSSPANRRSVFDRDQYANWAGGAGYTIRQGLRVGASAYRGPYLYRGFPYYFPGESRPVELPATAWGVDAQWGRGHWNTSGEWQHFRMPYHAIPTFTRSVVYAETRRTLGPRWYAAARVSSVRASALNDFSVYEFAVGFRPAARQLIKTAWQAQAGPGVNGGSANVIAVQYVIGLPSFSLTH